MTRPYHDQDLIPPPYSHPRALASVRHLGAGDPLLATGSADLDWASLGEGERLRMASEAVRS